jgi:hypothetical protein
MASVGMGSGLLGQNQSNVGPFQTNNSEMGNESGGFKFGGTGGGMFGGENPFQKGFQ